MSKFKIGDKVMIIDGKLPDSGTPVYWLGCVGTITEINPNVRSIFPYLVQFAPEGQGVNTYSLNEAELKKLNSQVIKNRLGIK